MSELKAYKMVNELYCTDRPSVIPAEVYFKSEADKVIAELKKKIEEQKQLRDMALASVPNALKVAKIIQHNKYKRCLAMAAVCFEKSYSTTLVKYDKESGLFRNFYDWWGKRWLALAEEPTWAKFLQLIHKEGK